MLTTLALSLALQASPTPAPQRTRPSRPPRPTEPARAHQALRLVGGSEVEIDLGDLGHDMQLDEPRNLLYVSIPVRNEVAVIDLGTMSIVDRVLVGTRPHGIDLSADGTTLYCALNQASSVAYLDLATRTVTETVNIGSLLGHATTWDVAEAAPDRIFVSANPSSGGFA